MKECAECGYVNPSKAEQCINCGADLLLNTGTPETEEENVQEQTFAASRKEIVEEPPQKMEEKEERRKYELPNRRPTVEPPKVVPPRQDRGTMSVSDYRSKRNIPANDGRSTIPLRKMHSVGEENLPSGFKLISDTDKTEIEFDNLEQMLNRDNVDVGNMSISGKSHARIYYENGKWMLEDKSSNKATFVQIREPVELKDDVIVILGQKIFRFKSKE